jgi:hypothetical protein
LKYYIRTFINIRQGPDSAVSRTTNPHRFAPDHPLITTGEYCLSPDPDAPDIGFK